MKKHIISTSSEWTVDLLREYDIEIGKLAKEFGLSTYPSQIEIISSEQMIDVYSTIGMPLGYSHWSFGKQFMNIEKSYKKGYMYLAYEMVINSNPSIAYLLEENTLTMQAMVIAHACYGHNSFFKNNYLFTTWTDADSIIDYLLFAKNYIASCEEKYGVTAVEELLDSCHALMTHGVDRYKRPAKISMQEEKARQQAREIYLQSQVNDLWRTIPKSTQKKSEDPTQKRFPEEPQENILYFIEKNAPLLEPWQREIVRICRKVAQYFYPQRQTKVMNEGWATFWHYTLINALYDAGKVDDDFMLEFLHYHTNVISQPRYDQQLYKGINPYTLGFAIFTDIRRICENPTEEDKEWFPDLVNTDWVKSLDFAMRNFKDESFIAQYLSPKLIRDLKLFSILDDENNPELIVTAIHDNSGYRHIRETLSAQYSLAKIIPNIEVYNVNMKGDRAIILRHIRHDNIPLGKQTDEVLKHLHRLWGFEVILESVDTNGNVIAVSRCPQPEVIEEKIQEKTDPN